LDYAYRTYGAGLANLTVILNCRDPELGHKQRVRFTKATRTLGIDVMLPLDRFVRVPHQQRRLIIADSMLMEIPRLVRKYDFPEFETERFLEDFERYVADCLLSPEADRFDHLCLP
jgi:hypothetical protein